jgi:broad specificity phosphatase PhoE
MNISADNIHQFSSQRSESSQEDMFLENFYKYVSLRQKNLNQLYDSQRTRKRLSDSILTSSQLQVPTNLDILPDQNTDKLNSHRSFYFQKLPTIFQTIPPTLSSVTESEPQKLFVIRHGERVDSTFGSNWLDQVFDRSTGVYRRINLNLPKKMVTRKDFKDFLFDPPLTELGLHQCQIIGEELAAQGIKIDHVYSSPTLRCIQTADKILEGLQTRDTIPIRIEPCLFEFLKWYPVIPVKWPFLDIDELKENGFHIDRSYQPFYPIESLRKDEDELMFYTRSYLITTSILKNHESNKGNILIVGHVKFSFNKILFLFLFHLGIDH